MWPYNHSTVCVHIHNTVGEQIVDFLDQVNKLFFAGRRESRTPFSKIKDTLHFTPNVSILPDLASDLVASQNRNLHLFKSLLEECQIMNYQIAVFGPHIKDESYASLNVKMLWE